MKKHYHISQIVLLCSLLYFFTSSVFGQIYISPYDRVYDDLRYLQTYGFIGSLNLNRLPITNTELQITLKTDMESESFKQVSPLHQSMMRRIYRDYGLGREPEKADLLSHLKRQILNVFSSDSYDEASLIIGGTLDFSLKTGDETKVYPLVRTFGSVNLPFDMSFVNIMALDPYATEDTNYIGREWRGMSGYTEQAYMLWYPSFLRKKHFETRVIAGRCYLINGRGRKGSLLFSSACRPMDQIRLEFASKHFAFQTIAAKLDKYNNDERYLSAHRLTLFFGRFQIAVNEVLLYGGANRDVEWVYLNPFLFYHAEQVNGPGLDGNTIGSVDFYYAGKRWGMYGELLIDDIQLDKQEPGDLEPNEIGGLVGIDIADPFGWNGVYVGCEYVAITNRTYKTPNRYEIYLHRNVPIGYPLGSDLDRWNVNVKKYFTKWQIIGELDVIRRGEGEMSKSWDQPWMNYTVKEGYSEPFPTGVVEKTMDVGLEVRYLPDYRKYIFLQTNYRRIENIGHSDKNEKDFVLTVGLHWFLSVLSF